MQNDFAMAGMKIEKQNEKVKQEKR